jgi:selenoprotein W-related protein
LATKLLETYKQKIKSLSLVPAGGGCFELKLNGKLVYSKLKSGDFPDEDAMIDLVGERG